ncbi:DExH-box ATP-dependent RNA helicase DExH17 isoform X5 [Gossypium australe]|uniref:DExH-box ATP-dependent RNA helicase DExH17 isoform X5 n=1 Tax=Gossypium australe TaxID=47621 RepID=A0A5B6W6P2_9ROSI|nr:DExH-box ATP-dependent RNA helicase DExH17 isoform X5 [Gossypium australe]
MIQTDQDGFALKPQEPGRMMTMYYLKFNTMKHIMQAPSSCSLEKVLQIICHAEEIACMYSYLLRRNEKKLMNDINGDKDGRLRFHVSGDKENGKNAFKLEKTRYLFWEMTA